MIASFRSKSLQRFFASSDAKKLSVQHPDGIGRLLRALDQASAPEDMNLPGLYFHLLKGLDRGRYSLRVSGNWRITFSWRGDDAVDVDLEDYH